MMKVVYQGEPGAYSEAATHELLASLAEGSFRAVGLASFEDCFEAVDCGDAAYAMLPIENSLGGSIHANFDHQLRHENLHIVAEWHFRVKHNLMALPSTTLADVKEVRSHPQALAQCAGYIRKIGKTPFRAYDTAGAAKQIREEQLTDCAAVASELAAKHYGLKILDSGIEDDPNNYTRFLLIGRSHLPRSALDGIDPAVMKTSVVFSLVNEPGALFKAMAAFSLRNVDLTKIESRPDKIGLLGNLYTSSAYAESGKETTLAQVHDLPRDTSRFKYMFYVDVAESVYTSAMRNCLGHLSEISPYLRVTGTYPSHGSMPARLLRNLFAEETVAESLEATLNRLRQRKRDALRIGIIGFGTFGQFLAKKFVERGHAVIATSRSDYSQVAKEMGVTFFPGNDARSVLGANVNCLIISTSILSFESVIAALPMDLLKGMLVIDVLSVKRLAKTTMVEKLPPSADILCLHPMFGPESGKHSWAGLPLVSDCVRVRPQNQGTAAAFLRIFEQEDCAMIQMTCEEHDKIAAGTQFVTHFTGRMLGRLRLEDTSINTKGYETLLKLVENTEKDSFDLFYALYKCNPSSEAQMEALQRAMNEVCDKLSGGKSASKPKSMLTERVQCIQESKTSTLFAAAKKKESEGADLVNLIVGEPDYAPPQKVLQAMADACSSGAHQKYTITKGTAALRTAIAKDLARRKSLHYDPASEIVVTHGAKQALFLALNVLCEPGDEVIIPAPFYVSYPEMVRVTGARPVIVECKEEESFKLTPSALQAALTPRTKAIILCSPCNPTGTVHSKAEFEALAASIEKKGIFVISDEIYERLLFGVEHASFAEIEYVRDQVVTINGFSKSYAMTGSRLGYLAANSTIASACLKLQSQLNTCPNALAQHGGCVALTQVTDRDLNEIYSVLSKRAALVYESLIKIPRITCVKPEGAFYAFPNISAYLNKTARTETGEALHIDTATSFCAFLIEHHGLAIVPGDAFGAPGYVRICFTSSLDVLRRGMSRFQAALSCIDV